MFESKVTQYKALAEQSNIYNFSWDGTEPFRTTSFTHVPERVYGVYIFRIIATGECIYVGKAGTVTNNGTLKAQDARGRLNNTRGTQAARVTYAEWLQKYGPLSVEIITTWHFGEAPGFVEADLLQTHLSEFRRLPKENDTL